MVSYLGTTIEAKGKVFNLENGAAKFSFDLQAQAVESTLTIQDALGKTVWSAPVSTDPGKEVITWDGKKSDGTQAPDGAYTAVISAKDRDGKLIDVAQTVFGRVTGAGAANGKVTLSMGAVDAPLDDVLNVKETPAPAI